MRLLKVTEGERKSLVFFVSNHGSENRRKIKYLKNYNQNGIAFPFQINQYLNSEDLEKEYLKYNSKSEKIFNRKLSLKPHPLSTFFTIYQSTKTIIEQVKKLLEKMYTYGHLLFSKEPGEAKKL